MATDPGARTTDTAMDATSLYREDIYTDRKIGTLRVLLPVKSDGSPDTARRTLYQGEAQLMTNMGPLPISFDIDATSLADKPRHRSCCRRRAPRSAPAARFPAAAARSSCRSGAGSTRRHAGSRAKRCARKSMNERTFADRCRRLGYTA